MPYGQNSFGTPILYVKFPGGNASALNLSAAAVIHVGPVTLSRVFIIAPGGEGNLTLNDCATLDAAGAVNQIVSVPYSDLVAGKIIPLDWPCANGIVLSSLPSGGVISLSAQVWGAVLTINS